MLYNDAWQPILGDTKHPAGLGRPGAESWPETWPVVGAQFESALKGVASWSEDLLLASDRRGFLQESYFTYSHGPLRDASGTVVGVLSVVSETTARVLNERRLQRVARLSTAMIDATRRLEPIANLCQLLVDSLCLENPDVPFAAQYLADSTQRVRRVAVSGLDATRLPESVDRTSRDEWGVAQALRDRSHVAVRRSVSEGLPGGIWPEPTTELLALPLWSSGHDADLSGVLVVGINSRLRLDTPYVDFLGLVAAQFASAISALQFVHREHEARADAQRASRLRDDFLATLSHELRSPLNAVLGWAQILKSNSTTRPELIATAVDVIERNARLQGRLITDLLDISRAISGNLSLELQDVEVAKVIDAAIQSVAPMAAKKRIAVTTVIEPIQRSVRGDPSRIEQMLWNLLSNALKFTPEGGRVQVATEEAAGYLRIRVSDTGEGIDPTFLPHLFERFRQADASSSRRHEGLGVGLAIVKQFAELQGGRVSAMSDGPGHGATFALDLPLGDDRVDATTSATVAATALSQVQLRGRRILVIDDQPDALLVLKHILEDAGASVTTLSRAEDALEVLSAEQFDAIVCDIAMPGMDGYDFVAHMAKRKVDTPAIALTSFALSSDVSRAMAAGFKAHVSKPVDRTSLLEIVSRFASPDLL
jgi:signal transduction histidine kinase